MPDNLSIKNVSLTLYIFFTLIFGILWQGGEFFWFGLAGSSIVLLLIFHIHKYYSEPLLLPKSLINTTVLLFAAWCLLTVIWSVVPHISLIRAITIMAAPIGIYSYFYLTHSSMPWEKLWQIVIAVGLLLVLYSLIEVYLGIKAPNSLFFNKNTHAAYLNIIILPTVAYFLLSNKNKSQLLLGIILFLLIYSHALPGSRGATLGQFIGLGMIVIAAYKHIPPSRIRNLIGIIIAAFGLATLTTSNMLRFVAYKIEDADLGRWEIWEGAINLLKDTPWYGSGVGTYWLTHPAYRHFGDPSSGQNPHNDYLQFLIEAGLPGFLILLTLVLLIPIYWWKTIRNREFNPKIKIESAAILGAITAIGFHSFFTFNLGVYAILFLIGILLGRYFQISGQIRSINLSTILPIRKKLVSLFIATFAMVSLGYFSSLSVYSQLYTRAALAYISGDISKTDRLNSLALSVYPQDDRPYLLYAFVYEKILEKVPELTDKKKNFYFNQALSYIDKALNINPYRAKAYLLKARLYASYPELANKNAMDKAEALYLKSLEVNPRYKDATLQLARLYIRLGQEEKAAQVAINQIMYWRPVNEATHKYYKSLGEFIEVDGNPEHLNIYKTKLDQLESSLKLKGIPID